MADSNDYDKAFKDVQISDERWAELANSSGLTVEEYKMLHRKAWESFTYPKHRMYMQLVLDGMIARYKDSKNQS